MSIVDTGCVVVLLPAPTQSRWTTSEDDGPKPQKATQEPGGWYDTYTDT